MWRGWKTRAQAPSYDDVVALAEPTQGFRSVDELGVRSAEVVEAARHGAVHLRTASGDVLVLLAQRQFDEIARWIRAVLDASRALASPGAERRPEDFGDAPWLAVLDDEDLTTFVDEIQPAILDAVASGRAGDLDALGDEWRSTATVLADPVSREILLGPHDPDDFVEVPRPA